MARGRGFPTSGDLVIVTLRNVKGRWLVVEDAHVLPPKVTWSHDERGRPVDQDGEPVYLNHLAYFGAQKMYPGDTIGEQFGTFGLSEVVTITRRKSRSAA